MTLKPLYKELTCPNPRKRYFSSYILYNKFGIGENYFWQFTFWKNICGSEYALNILQGLGRCLLSFILRRHKNGQNKS